MALSAFDDKSHQPTDEDLLVTLGNTYVYWNELQRLLELRLSPMSTEWGFTSKSTGWGMRVRHGERIIVYMTPCKGYFLASFALGEKAVKAAHESDLPSSVLTVIDGAKKYAEGRGVRLEVHSADLLSSIEKLAIAKMKN